MMRRASAIVTAICCLLSSQASALGLGSFILESALNQPLRARIEIVDLGEVSPADVVMQLASQEDFRRFNLERAGFFSDVDITVENTSQGLFMVLTSNQAVREPYLSFILDTRWPNGRILSEHTVLLDLPVYSDGRSVAEPINQPVSPAVGNAPSIEAAAAAEVSAPIQETVTASDSAPIQIGQEVELAVESQEANASLVTGSQDALAAAETAEAEQSQALESEPDPESIIDSQDAADQSDANSEIAVASETEATETEATGVDTSQPLESEVAPESEETTEQELVVTRQNIITDTEGVTESIEVSPQDTLWEIAMRVRPADSASIQQTMLAIQRLNPEAFVDGNINRLRAGETLQIPDLSRVQSVTQQQAISEVARQNQQVGIDTQPLAAPSAGPSSQAAVEQQGQLRVLTADDTEPASVGASAEVENESAELDARIQALENQLALQQEEADRAELQRTELIARLSELDAQITSALEIIRLQDQQLAQLQQSLAEAAAQASLQQNQAAGQVEQTDGALVQSGPDTGNVRGFLQSIATVLGNNSWILLAVSALVVFLMVLLLLRRNRAVSADGLDAEFDGELVLREESDLHSGADSEVSEITDSASAESEREQIEELAELATASFADPDEQEIVIEGEMSQGVTETETEFDLDLDLDPGSELGADKRPGVDLENNEAMAGESDSQAMELDQLDQIQAVALEQSTREIDDDSDAKTSDEVVDLELDAAEEDGESEDPDSEVLDFDIEDFLDEGEADEAHPDPGQDRAERLDDESETDIDFELDTEDEEHERKPDESVTAESDTDEIEFFTATEQADEPTIVDSGEASESDSEVDFYEFDLNEEVPKADAETTENLQNAREEDELELLDFEIADDTADPSPDDAGVDIASPSDGEIETFDFALDPDSDTESDELPEDLDQELESHESVDFELDIESLEEQKAGTEEENGDDTIIEEFEEIEFMNDEPESEEAEESSGMAVKVEDPVSSNDDDGLEDLEFLPFEEDTVIGDPESESDFLSDVDEAATKLELAYAYQKMGDVDGAREILNEVLAQGNEVQVIEARKLLETLDS